MNHRVHKDHKEDKPSEHDLHQMQRRLNQTICTQTPNLQFDFCILKFEMRAEGAFLSASVVGVP